MRSAAKLLRNGRSKAIRLPAHRVDARPEKREPR